LEIASEFPELKAETAPVRMLKLVTFTTFAEILDKIHPHRQSRPAKWKDCLITRK
jgi:adenosyl cobinamide kinase/adenosyl cobinamide phosphate guanylyltransferase